MAVGVVVVELLRQWQLENGSAEQTDAMQDLIILLCSNNIPTDENCNKEAEVISYTLLEEDSRIFYSKTPILKGKTWNYLFLLSSGNRAGDSTE